MEKMFEIFNEKYMKKAFGQDNATICDFVSLTTPCIMLL